MLVALAVALPFSLLTAGVVWKLADNERESQRQAIAYSTRTLISTVDALLDKQIAVGRILAASPALLADDLVEFRKEAERARPGLSGGWIILAEAGGRQLINMARPSDEPLPPRQPSGLELQSKALSTGEIQISNVSFGRFLNTQVISIEVPVLRPGKPPLGIAIIMESSVFKSLMDERHLPTGWLGGLIDRNGNFIARTRDHDRNVGQPASEGFRTAAKSAKDGWFEFSSLEGESIANHHSTSELSGWVMALATDTAAFDAPVRRTIGIAALAGGAATILAVLLAVWAARRIAAPIEQIEQGTHALLRREPISFARTGVAEVDRALEAFAVAAETLEQHEKDRDEREAHVRLIMRELSHRSKNLLAIVLAIARQTSRTTSNFQEFEERFNARIQALADAHDLLVEQQWTGATLDDLIRAQLSAFGTERIIVKGDRVMLRAEAVQNVALAIHELATNAVKYGALSVPEGRVHIEWGPHGDDPENPGVRLVWRETGGPPVSEPERTGFGRFVLERVTVNALGSGGAEFRPSGLVWTCDITADHLTAPPPGRGAQKPGEAAGQRLAS
jgi:two-component sensor histidine kinase